MTELERAEIVFYRNQQFGYKKIAKLTGIPLSTIKSYCQKIGQLPAPSFCLQCKRPITQTKGRKTKKFCSDRCRMAWWNDHKDLVKKKAFYEYICPVCGKRFIAYGNAHRKYCSRECQIEGRFGRDDNAGYIAT